MNVDIHSTCLIMTLSCLKSPLLCALFTNLSHLTTNLFLYVLFCVFSVCYDVRLSHLNKDYLLTYLLTYVDTSVIFHVFDMSIFCMSPWMCLNCSFVDLYLQFYYLFLVFLNVRLHIKGTVNLCIKFKVHSFSGCRNMQRILHMCVMLHYNAK